LTKVVCAISSLSPKEFILRYIIFEAKAMLLKSDITVEAVAEQLGFTDASAFSALFKKHTGRSPKDFRMQNFKI
jgi:iron complex transport system substrate-binding protein